MATMTVGELLDGSRDFEVRLTTCYAKIRDQSPDNGVRLLTYFLARHRRYQKEALQAMAPDSLRSLRQVTLKVDAPYSFAAGLRLSGLAPTTVTGNELIADAMAYAHERVSFYRSILAQPINDNAREVLEALIRVEERDIVMLNKMLAMHYF